MFGDATMGMEMSGCGCGQAPMVVPQTSMQPVYETVMRPQQVTTYTNVPKTIMRQEAVQVQVPTTTYKQVAVDEGGYQQVWVPRMVTKNVPQTIMQTQLQYRQVPQTVMEQVSQVTTRMVPEQVVRHVSTPMLSSSNGQGYALSSSSFPIATPTTVTPVPEYNNPAPSNPVPYPTSDSAALPTPVAPQTSQIQEWQQVRQRTSTIQQQAYEVESVETGYRVPKAAGRFSSKR